MWLYFLQLLTGDELREVVRGLIAKLEADGVNSWPATLDNTQSDDDHEEGDGRGHEWLKALRWCPRELLDLVNSKACRGVSRSSS